MAMMMLRPRLNAGPSAAPVRPNYQNTAAKVAPDVPRARGGLFGSGYFSADRLAAIGAALRDDPAIFQRFMEDFNNRSQEMRQRGEREELMNMRREEFDWNREDRTFAHAQRAEQSRALQQMLDTIQDPQERALAQADPEAYIEGLMQRRSLENQPITPYQRESLRLRQGGASGRQSAPPTPPPGFVPVR